MKPQNFRASGGGLWRRSRRLPAGKWRVWAAFDQRRVKIRVNIHRCAKTCFKKMFVQKGRKAGVRVCRFLYIHFVDEVEPEQLDVFNELREEAEDVPPSPSPAAAAAAGSPVSTSVTSAPSDRAMSAMPEP